MKKVLTIVGVVLLLLAGGLSAFVATYEPKQRPALDETVEITEARLTRGAYLVENVLACFECHNDRDWTKFGGPPIEPRGAGGPCYGEEYGNPGKICSPNITPDEETGIGSWTDGEIMRAIREGVDKDGKIIFPMMPYNEYSRLSDEDTRAVVAYLRKLPPVRNDVEETRIDFPVSFFIKMAAKPLDGPVGPPAEDQVATGEYLAKVGGCKACHTPVDSRHVALPGKEFAGGQAFPGPWGNVNSANLTKHANGIAAYSEESFRLLLQNYKKPEAQVKVEPERNTIMPWLVYANMTDEDINAIYAYLQTVKPQPDEIEKRPAR